MKKKKETAENAESAEKWSDRRGLSSSASLGVLGGFSPLPDGLGLPVPDPAALPGLVVGQQAMPSAIGHDPYVAAPYTANEPQHFDRLDVDLPFFTALPFGTVVEDVNWWAADGVPALPVDDAGRTNAYPLFRIQAREAGMVLATTDIVVPVASSNSGTMLLTELS